MQFAYNRDGELITDGAVATLINNVTKHLEKAGNYIRILFIDVISAFNAIQRYKMIEKLLSLQVPPTLFIGCITFSATYPNMLAATPPQHHHEYWSAPRVCLKFDYQLPVHQRHQEQM